MREKIIEQQLVQAVKHKSGICPKFVSPGYDGMPDRLVLLPHGCIAFVELKAPGKKNATAAGTSEVPVRNTWFSGILHRQ